MDLNDSLIIAADAGDVPSMLQLASIHEKDLELSQKYLQMASDMNDPYAKFRLGDLKSNQDKDLFAEEINALWVDSATLGNVDAMFRLGLNNMLSRSTTDLSDNGHDANSWMMQAAEKGHATAMLQQGTMCMCMQPASNAQHLKAEEWFLKAQTSTVGEDHEMANKMATMSLENFKGVFAIYKTMPNFDTQLKEDRVIRKTTCHHCGKLKTEEHTLKICKCRQVRYCNIECQKAAWATHRAMCKKWQKIMTKIDNDKRKMEEE